MTANVVIMNSGRKNHEGNSGIVTICVSPQSLVSPVNTYGYISNWFVALGL